MTPTGGRGSFPSIYSVEIEKGPYRALTQCHAAGVTGTPSVEIEKGPYRVLKMFRCQGCIPDRFKIIRHEDTPLEGVLNRQRFSKGVFLCVSKMRIPKITEFTSSEVVDRGAQCVEPQVN